jgi:Methylmalonyl-CoA mutase, C-terminal domain/subunit (cobalamin-binding)
MDASMLEYIRGIKPDAHASGKDLVEEGIKIGNSFKAGRGRFITESNGKYSCHMDYKKECMKNGKIIWDLLVGLATIDEECDALAELHRRATELGYEIPYFMCIASPLVGLPKEYREKAPSTTSYILDGLADYEKHRDAAPADVIFGDHHLVTPNAIETTINALKVGSPRVGEFSQFIWDYTGFDDELKRYSDMVISLGIMASKRDEMFAVETYLDDGFPGYFMDCASYIGYALLEHYICSDLCNARYSISFAGLLSEIDTRIAIPLALHRLMSTEEQPVMSYINGSTNMQWDHDINGNFGFSSQEMLFEILAEKKFHMGLGINPVSITEKIAVPTMDELWDIFVAGKRVEEKADEWLPFMDFSKIEEMADVMMEQGTIFFNNTLEGLKEAGIDIEDPLEMLLTLKHFNPMKFEQAFHPTTYNNDQSSIRPFFPTVLGRQTMEMIDEKISEMKENGHSADELKGKKIVIGSGDAHTYGIIFVEGILSAMGATVINGGVDMDAIDMLDLADEEGSTYIGVSCHNGQALDYGKQLLELAGSRGKDYSIFMGGKLNAILPGHSEPTEIGNKLTDLGIDGSNEIEHTIDMIKKGLF